MAEKFPSLTSEQKLKAENHKLKVSNFQLKQRQMQIEINSLGMSIRDEALKLISEFRNQLNEKDENKIFNWDTLSFVGKPNDSNNNAIKSGPAKVIRRGGRSAE